MSAILADALRDLTKLYNYAEVLIWPAIGLTLLIASFWRAGVVRRDFRLAAVVLLAFGASDYFEAENGNEWWRPWWLFLWKAACVAALLAILGMAFIRQRKARSRLAPSPSGPSGRVLG
jgi:hypothetical protein